MAKEKRRIVVTGVSRGLGRAMLDGFTKLGHDVFGCATNADTVSQLRQEFDSDHFHTVDVSDDDQVGSWAESVLQSGPPDLLVNNAALMNSTTQLWNVRPKEFAALMNVNITGTFHVIRHFLPSMLEHGSGVIVNFSSGWGRSTSPEVVPYCASKFAIEGLSRGLAQELPRGVAAVALNPGVINTDMLNLCWGEGASSYPSPEEWADRAVPFMLGLDGSDNGRSLDVPSY